MPKRVDPRPERTRDQGNGFNNAMQALFSAMYGWLPPVSNLWNPPTQNKPTRQMSMPTTKPPVMQLPNVPGVGGNRSVPPLIPGTQQTSRKPKNVTVPLTTYKSAR